MAYQGRLSSGGSGFGSQLVGDFSPLTNADRFVIRTSKEDSLPFRIGTIVYEDALRKVQ